jgi:hypothetical protein
MSIFTNEDDVICTSTHSGRTDSRWYRVIGPLYMTYYFRFKRIPHESVPELLLRSAKQIITTMDHQLTNVKADEIFFQYQGDILGINEIGAAPAELQDMQLDAMPFHMQVMNSKKGYYYQLRFWENRYDREQLELFLRSYKAILNAMMNEPSVRRLKKYVSDADKPKHFYIEAGKVNDAAGFMLIPGLAADTKVKAYVFDSSCMKKPIGGWGDLYIMDHPTKDYIDQIENPYGDGTLYQTGLTARITPAGEVDLLKGAGRTVMLEKLTGRAYIDLGEVERVVCEVEGVTSAKAYTFYGNDNLLFVGVDVTGVTDDDAEKIKAHVAECMAPVCVPAKIVCL